MLFLAFLQLHKHQSLHLSLLVIYLRLNFLRENMHIRLHQSVGIRVYRQSIGWLDLIDAGAGRRLARVSLLGHRLHRIYLR